MAADITLDGCTAVVVVNQTSSGGSENLVEMTGASTLCEFRGASGRNLQYHGIVVSGASDCLVAANVIDRPGAQTANTYDGVILSGNSDRNMIVNNKVIPRTSGSTRYGVNVSAATCDDNVVADNMLIPSASFGTGSFNDAGTGTVTSRDGNGQFT